MPDSVLVNSYALRRLIEIFFDLKSKKKKNNYAVGSSKIDPSIIDHIQFHHYKDLFYNGTKKT